MPNHPSHEETHDAVYADQRNFYKVEKWSRDWLRVELMLYAGNDLDKARRMFEQTIKARPRQVDHPERGCWRSGLGWAG
jgi:hypothetical protein